MSERKTNDPTSAARQNSNVILISEDLIYGPFPSQDVAQEWIENHQQLSRGCRMFSVWQAETGTAERAHECGTLLRTVDEVTERQARTG